MGEGRKDNIGTATKQERTGQKGGKEGLRERERERGGGGGGGGAGGGRGTEVYCPPKFHLVDLSVLFFH